MAHVNEGDAASTRDPAMRVAGWLHGQSRRGAKYRFCLRDRAGSVRRMFMKLWSSCLLLAALLTPSASFAAQAGADAAFQKIADEFLHGYFAFSPLESVGLGLHEYDGLAPDYSRTALDAERKRLHEFERRLADFPARASLSPASEFDFRVLQLAVRSGLFGFEEAHHFEKNPMTYAEAIDFNVYLKRDFAPLGVRLRFIAKLARIAPAFLANARGNLADPLPKPKVTLAIEIAKGSAEFLEKDLAAAMRGVADANLLAEVMDASAKASAAFREYAAWLEKEKLPRADDQFALGEERYKKFLATRDAITLAPEKILEIGLAELKREQAAFAEAAKIDAPGKSAIEAMRELQRDHPTADSLVPETRKNLEAIRQFLIDRAIITMPSEVRATVAETPPPQRAGSFASMDTPGPFEKRGAEAYYYVTPVEKEWSDKEKDEWLGAFNRFTADVVSIHEAYPGHYLQFLHLNASAVSRIRKIFGSYAFTEGWAHYCEQMLIDAGYGGTGEEGAKYRLAQSDEALLRLCRLCVSVKMHCHGMSVDEATKFFRDNCYYEEKPARSEAMRGTFDPGYLFYTLGKLQILKLRRDFEKQEGAAYSLKKFHDAVCDHGQMPVRLLREILLKDSAGWDATL